MWYCLFMASRRCCCSAQYIKDRFRCFPTDGMNSFGDGQSARNTFRGLLACLVDRLRSTVRLWCSLACFPREVAVKGCAFDLGSVQTSSFFNCSLATVPCDINLGQWVWVCFEIGACCFSLMIPFSHRSEIREIVISAVENDRNSFRSVIPFS
jgi:hypothetical protein